MVRAIAVLAFVMIVAGCGGAATPAATTVVQASVAVPPPSVPPTEAAAGSTPPEATPTPTPTPVPLKDVESILALEPAGISATKVTRDLGNAWEVLPSIQAVYSKVEWLDVWDFCQHPKPLPGVRHYLYNQQVACQGLVFDLFNAYQQTGDPTLYLTAADVYRFGQSILESPYKEQEVDYLRTNLK